MIKIQWLSPIWCQKLQNNAKTKVIKLHEFLWFDVQTIKTTQNCKSNQITMNLHRFDIKMIKNVECRKTFKTTENYKSDQNKMNCIDLMSQNIQSNAKLQKRSNYDEFASIWRPNDQKCWVTSQNIQNR